MKPKYSLINNIIYYFKKQWLFSKISIIVLFLTIPITIGKTVMGVLLPKIAVQLAISNGPIHQVLSVIAVVGGSIILIDILDYLLQKIKFPLMLKYRYSMVEEKIRKALFTDYKNLENPSFRLLMSRADESLWGSGNGSLVEQMTSGTVQLFTQILLYFILGAFLTSVNPWIAVVLTVSSIVSYYSIKLCQKYWYTNREEISKIDKKISYIVRSCVTFEGAPDIRLFGLNQWFVRMFKKLTQEKMRWNRKYFIRTYLANIVDAFLILLRDGAAYAVLIFMVLNRGLSIDAFVLGFASIGSFAGTVGSIINGVGSLYKTNLTTNDFRDYLEYREIDNRETKDLNQKQDTSFSIKLKGVSFKYDGEEDFTLKNIDLTINPGEKVAIVGLNGAGKTTLVKIICGLYDPTDGEILLNDQKKSAYNIDYYYSLFSAVFQDYHFLPVSIACAVSSKTEKETDRKLVIEALKLSGLWGKVASLENGIDTPLNKQLNKNAVEFSGGEWQKLVLARAIYKQAPILILDEPTAALDPIAEDKLYQVYNKLTEGKTSIFISHRLASTRFCDRIILLKNGMIEEVGSHYELMARHGEYEKMFKIQSRYYEE